MLLRAHDLPKKVKKKKKGVKMNKAPHNHSLLSIMLRQIDQLPHLIPITPHHFKMVFIAVLLVLYLAFKRRVTIYLLDISCYQPPKYYRLPISMYLEHISLDNQFDPDSVEFQAKILEKSGFSEETSIPPPLSCIPLRKSLSSVKEEAMTIMFSAITELIKKTNTHPKTIDILIVNCSLVSPTPSLTAMIINKFKMRSNIMSFNLSGMGCSAGVISVGMAKDLLKTHRNSVALIVSSELLNQNWYTGKNPSMLVTNCLFRMGGAAILMSSRNQDKGKAKYVLQHLIRTTKAQDDKSYNCVYEDIDSKNKPGLSISKGILNVAGDALKANIASLGPLVLPFSEQFRYTLSTILRKISQTDKSYTPDFKRAFQQFCIHAGGRAVIQEMEKRLRLGAEDVEASKMTLYRYGNTSSSSIWYELCYIEAKGRMKRGDKVWQIAFGSGFKCNSAVWKCIQDVGYEKTNAWIDEIHKYPVAIPDLVKIN